MDSTEIADVGLQIFLLFLKVAPILATLRLGFAGLQAIAGKQDAVEKAIHDTVFGVLTVLGAQTVVWLVLRVGSVVAWVKNGW
jgi:hypothetical protein